MSQVIAGLEQQLSSAKALVKRRDAALKLYENRDFKALIVDGFMCDEAARYVQASGDPALGESERADALAMAQASGHLKRFLSVVVVMGNTAARDVKGLEEAIDEERSGGAE
jgi:hypothetical protein